MENPKENSIPDKIKSELQTGKISIACFVLGTFIVYFFSNSKPQQHFDYTFRVAENMLRGSIGFNAQQPSWLNEFVFFDGFYYSVFPLGSVLTMIPFALLKVTGIVAEMPGKFIAALTAGAIGSFLLRIAGYYNCERRKKLLLTAAIIFGSWMWTNLTMASAWQLALGFAVLGEIGAIYFTVYNRKPLLAGLFFALAFGNRTEIILTAPIFMFLLTRPKFWRNESEKQNHFEEGEKNKTLISGRSLPISSLAKFCLAPFVLGVATLIYNYVRFNSLTDFGYARIPGVLNEPWYRHGIFSVFYVPLNVKEMLFTLWKPLNKFPYLVPTGFGGSILLSSPFLFLTLRFGAKEKILKYTAWAAILVLTILLWTHGNPGGWQFSYRYAMTLLPWVFIILLENGGEKITVVEKILYGFSILINAFATYLFHWTDYIKP